MFELLFAFFMLLVLLAVIGSVLSALFTLGCYATILCTAGIVGVVGWVARLASILKGRQRIPKHVGEARATLTLPEQQKQYDAAERAMDRYLTQQGPYPDRLQRRALGL